MNKTFNIEELNYDFCDKPTEDLIKEKRQQEKLKDIKPEMFDYMIGDNNSLRLEHIRSIKDENERIKEMGLYLKEIINQPFPDEFFEWLGRDILGLKFKKYEIEKMKRDYRIKKKRELKQKKENEKKQKIINKIKGKKIQFIKEPKTLKFH
jgi:hypothetical protein